VAATLVAGLVSLLTQLGFVKSRTIIKAEMISAASPQNPK
jgi:hypothetical protein